MLQYADFMFQIGMLDENQRDFFQSYAKVAVEHIQNKEFEKAFEVRHILHIHFWRRKYLTYNVLQVYINEKFVRTYLFLLEHDETCI